MEAASKGAHDNGGIVVGILPFDTFNDANSYCDIAIPTGIGLAMVTVLMFYQQMLLFQLAGNREH